MNDGSGAMFNVMSSIERYDKEELARLKAENDRLREALRGLLKAHIAHHNLPEHALARKALGAEKPSLPDWEELRGAAPNATGDLTSEEFVRESRAEWDRTNG